MPKKDTTSEENTPKISGKYFYASGKRKTSVARVKIFKGKGNININGRDVKDYFGVKTFIGLIKSPFKLTGATNQYDAVVKVEGGGNSSQAEAIRHAFSKALVEADSLNKPVLKKEQLLTRDARIKERKKFGLKRARKAPQFSKR